MSKVKYLIQRFPTIIEEDLSELEVKNILNSFKQDNEEENKEDIKKIED